MSILRRALERLKFGIGRFGGKAVPQFLPAIAECARAIGEDVVRKLGGAEADELRDGLLLGRRCSSLFAVQQVQQPDRLDIVLRAALP